MHVHHRPLLVAFTVETQRLGSAVQCQLVSGWHAAMTTALALDPPAPLLRVERLPAQHFWPHALLAYTVSYLRLGNNNVDFPFYLDPAWPSFLKLL